MRDNRQPAQIITHLQHKPGDNADAFAVHDGKSR
jgi:hypothetical protein